MSKRSSRGGVTVRIACGIREAQGQIRPLARSGTSFAPGPRHDRWVAGGSAASRWRAYARAMHGLTVRWSLVAAPDGVEDALRAYVEATSHSRYSGRKDLRFKTWRMRDGEWFEGCYVFETECCP